MADVMGAVYLWLFIIVSVVFFNWLCVRSLFHMTTPEQQIIYDLILKAWTNGKSGNN